MCALFSVFVILLMLWVRKGTFQEDTDVYKIQISIQTNMDEKLFVVFCVWDTLSI